jgi:Flp pilus assembly pilin Flp
VWWVGPTKHFKFVKTLTKEKIEMNKAIIGKLKKSKSKGQTALEYALVVTAISLVLMAAWNVFGDRVQQLITGSMLEKVEKQITKGNATVR